MAPTYCLWLVVVVGERQGRLWRLHALFVLPCGWDWRLWRYILLVAGCRGWLLSRLVGDNAPAALHAVGGEAMAPAAPTCFFVFLAPLARHIVGEHDSVLSEDCPTNSVPLLVGLTTMASSPTTVAGARCPTNRVPLLVGLTTMASSPTTAARALCYVNRVCDDCGWGLGVWENKICRRPLWAPLYFRQPRVAPHGALFPPTTTNLLWRGLRGRCMQPPYWVVC